METSITSALPSQVVGSRRRSRAGSGWRPQPPHFSRHPPRTPRPPASGPGRWWTATAAPSRDSGDAQFVAAFTAASQNPRTRQAVQATTGVSALPTRPCCAVDAPGRSQQRRPGRPPASGDRKVSAAVADATAKDTLKHMVTVRADQAVGDAGIGLSRSARMPMRPSTPSRRSTRWPTRREAYQSPAGPGRQPAAAAGQPASERERHRRRSHGRPHCRGQEGAGGVPADPRGYNDLNSTASSQRAATWRSPRQSGVMPWRSRPPRRLTAPSTSGPRPRLTSRRRSSPPSRSLSESACSWRCCSFC